VIPGARIPLLLRELADAHERTESAWPRQHIYFIQSGDSSAGPVKIGIAHHPEDRRKDLQVGNPEPLSVLLALPGDEPLERALHVLFAHLRIRGEWFRYRHPLRAFVEMLSCLHSESSPSPKALARRFVERMAA
jgi:hypothetical protein